MKRICIVNLKGGVGKTTTAVNLAYELALQARRGVLLCDMDKQGNSSKCVRAGIEMAGGMAALLTRRGYQARQAVRNSWWPKLDLVEGSMQLHKAAQEMLMDPSWPQQFRLSAALEQLEEDYDWAIMDCPPDTNLPVVNALCAADLVLVPVTPDKYALDGLAEILEQIEFAEQLNRRLKGVALVVTNFSRSSGSVRGMQTIREFAGAKELTIACTVRATDKVRTAEQQHQPLRAHSPTCHAAKDYAELARWVMGWKEGLQ